MIKVDIVLEEIDYNEVVNAMVPKLLEILSDKDTKLASISKVLTNMGSSPANMINAALNVLSQDQRNDLLANICTIYNDDIRELINQIMMEQQLSTAISDVKIQNIKCTL